MTLKSDAKFKRKLICGLKNDIKNLVNFHASSRKSENLHYDRILLFKSYKFLDKKIQKSYVLWHWRMMQNFVKKLTLGSKNNMRILVNFNASSGKSKNLLFDVLLFSIACKVLTEKVRSNYLSCHWRMI